MNKGSLRNSNNRLNRNCYSIDVIFHAWVVHKVNIRDSLFFKRCYRVISICVNGKMWFCADLGFALPLSQQWT